MNTTSRRGAADNGCTDTSIPADNYSGLHNSRSSEMYSLHEALARERMREMHEEAQVSRVARELAAARRWRRRELRARAAHQRHALLAEQAASASAALGR